MLLLDEVLAAAAEARQAAVLAAAVGARLDAAPPTRDAVRRKFDNWLMSSQPQAAPDDSRGPLRRALGLRR